MENNHNKKILFIANQELNCAPNQRFRFEQYLEYFSSQGFQWDISPLLSSSEVQVLYTPGHLMTKAKIIRNSYSIRRKDSKRIKDYDIVFVSREALMTGSVFFETKLASSGVPFIFDFDDAIWHENVSPANKKFKWLKKPSKTADIIKMASLIIAGNSYLADYAQKLNKNVFVIPTTVDTDKFIKINRKANDKTIIGWSGSKTTIAHFKTILPVLEALKAKYGDKIDFKVIGDDSFFDEKSGIKGMKWSPADEVERMNDFDIGIMPLPDDEWSMGKCGLKGLTYMSCEIPSVFSAVGVNNEIIENGRNGFLARTIDEWRNYLSRLIEEPELRQQIGKEGRKTVVEKYSVLANREKYLACFNSLTKAF